jgi:hypothetical protein
LTVQRDLSTRLVKLGRLSLVFEPRDIWVGLYAGPDAVYLTLIPCLPLRWERVPDQVTFTWPNGTKTTVDRRGNVVDDEPRPS